MSHPSLPEPSLHEQFAQQLHLQDSGDRSVTSNGGAAESSSSSSSPSPRRNRVEDSFLKVPADHDVGAMLRHVPLLGKLTDHERAKLGGVVELQRFTDEHIFKQGDEGLGFYIIKDGTCVVELTAADGRVSELARLFKGDFFGETALLTDKKRGAGVRAIGQVDTWFCPRGKFHSLFAKDRLNIQFAKRKGVTAEGLGGQERPPWLPKIPSDTHKEKSEATRYLLLNAVKDNVLFMNLDYEQRHSVVDEMYSLEVKEGVDLIQQGQVGDNLYVVEKGMFHVFVNDKYVASRGVGSVFGELALMYNSARAATVRATSDSVVWAVDRFTFRRIVTNLSARKHALYVAFLNKVELLAPLAAYERAKIAEALEEVTYAAGTRICRQGDEGNCMFLVHEGEVVITRLEKATGEYRQVMRCRKGDYFGERALLRKEPRAATAVASGRGVRLLRLDRNAFDLLLGPLAEIMRERVDQYDLENSEAVKKPSQSAAGGRLGRAEPRRRRLNVKLEDLKLVGTLGRGSFGHVQLVMAPDQNTYALKSVWKSQIVQGGQQSHIMSEKRVLERLSHPFLVCLLATHREQNRLHFLMEASLGGELFSVLRERSIFDEATARFYAGSVVLAFEYMHDRDIIYRDLKPENLLLDEQGFLKITDFGFAKDISETGRTWTLCGTPDYLAPEIVAGKGHGKGVDWWTLGIFIYEMLASYPPFYDEDPMKTYRKIMAGQIGYPSDMSKEAVNLIHGLLQQKETMRLGVVRGGAKLIRQHPWFHGFDFERLYRREIQPPIIPKVRDRFDLSNFDEYPPSDPNANYEFYEDDGSNWDADF